MIYEYRRIFQENSFDKSFIKQYLTENATTIGEPTCLKICESLDQKDIDLFDDTNFRLINRNFTLDMKIFRSFRLKNINQLEQYIKHPNFIFDMKYVYECAYQGDLDGMKFLFEVFKTNPKFVKDRFIYFYAGKGCQINVLDWLCTQYELEDDNQEHNVCLFQHNYREIEWYYSVQETIFAGKNLKNWLKYKTYWNEDDKKFDRCLQWLKKNELTHELKVLSFIQFNSRHVNTSFIRFWTDFQTDDVNRLSWKLCVWILEQNLVGHSSYMVYEIAKNIDQVDMTCNWNRKHLLQICLKNLFFDKQIRFTDSMLNVDYSRARDYVLTTSQTENKKRRHAEMLLTDQKQTDICKDVVNYIIRDYL